MSNTISNGNLLLTSPLDVPSAGPVTVAAIENAGAAKMDGVAGNMQTPALYGYEQWGGIDNSGAAYTVATLPSAATMGTQLPGARINWVTDARRAAETAGNGSGCPVVWGPVTKGGSNVWLAVPSMTQVQA